jgi:hypothetical protein
MSWSFGSSNFNTIVHHGIKDVVQKMKQSTCFYFGVRRSIHHQITDLAQRYGTIYMIMYKCSKFAMHVSIL